LWTAKILIWHKLPYPHFQGMVGNPELPLLSSTTKGKPGSREA